MNLDHLAAFVAVADTGSFSKAAAAMGCPLATLSRKVALLEKELGARLLERTTRRVTVTELGADVLGRARRVLAAVDETEQIARRQSPSPRGVLKVAAGVEFGLQALTPLLGTFAAWYPDVEVDLELTGRTVDVVADGFDLAIRTGTPEPSASGARKLGEFAPVLVASPRFLAARGIDPASADPKDIEGLPGLVLNGRGDPPWTFTHAARRQRRTLRLASRVRSNNGSVILAAAEQGVGVASLPRFMVQASIARGRLTEVAPDWNGPATEIHAVFPGASGGASAEPALKTKLFLDFLKDNLRLD